VLRLEETAIGGAIVILAVAYVLPVRPLRLLTAATQAYLAALGALIARASQLLASPAPEGDLRPEVRALDAAYQELVAIADPLRPVLLGPGRHRLNTTLAVAEAVRYHGRDLVRSIRARPAPDPELIPALSQAASLLQTSIAAVLDALNGRPYGPYVRSAALLDQAGLRHPVTGANWQPGVADPVLHDFTLLDDALAQLAQVLRLPIRDAVQGTREVSPAGLARMAGRRGERSLEAAGPKHRARRSALHGALPLNTLRRRPGRAHPRHRAR